MNLVSQTALLANADHFDFDGPQLAAAPASKPGKIIIVTKQSSNYGTNGNDTFIGKHEGKTNYVGLGGNDVINTLADNDTAATGDVLYGDWLAPGHVKVAPSWTRYKEGYKFGDDALHGGAFDTFKSSEGNDINVLHGGHYGGYAVIHTDLGKVLGSDKVFMAADQWKLDSFEFAYKSKGVAVLKSVSITATEFGANGKLDFINTGQKAKLTFGDDTWGPHQPPKFDYDPGGERDAVMEFLEAGMQAGTQAGDVAGLSDHWLFT